MVKVTATLLYTTEEFITVLEFFAVGDSPTAVLFRAVKGGDRLPETKISAIFKVHLSLFSLTHFFIGHLTLPIIHTIYTNARMRCFSFIYGVFGLFHTGGAQGNTGWAPPDLPMIKSSQCTKKYLKYR